MIKYWFYILAVVCCANFSLAADADNDGIPDHEDPWPNDGAKPVVSSLWGVGGELWSSDSRLPFVGFSGYRDGITPPNVTRIVANVVDFGATGTEGSADDTQAFLDAIAHAETQVSASNHGVILVPAGVYDVTSNLVLTTSGMVLQGEGRDLSEIRFTYTGDAKGIVMGSGGLNWQYNQFQSTFNCKLDTAQMPALGDFTLHLASPMTQTFKNNLAAQGNRARIAQYINRAYNGTTPQLVENIYGGILKPEASGHSTLAQEFNVTVINDSTLEMDRPLRWTPTTEMLWNQPVQVSLRDTSATETHEMGVEDLTIRYQSPSFQGHNGIGENGININADHSWVRGVRIVNSDHSIWTEQTRAHVTISDIIVEADRIGPHYGPGVPWFYRVYGHVGIGVNGYDHLVRDFVLNNTYIHDVSMRHSQGCVVMSGQGVEMAMDHHRQTIYANVWTDIDLGIPHRMWDSTGDAPEGYQCGAYNTWWNIQSDDPSYANWPDDGNWMEWGTNMWGYFVINLVGTDLTSKPPVGGIPRAPDTYDPDNVHLEAIAQNELWPQNIYLAQREAYIAGRLWAPAISNQVPVADALSTNVLEDASVGIVLTGFDAEGSNLTFAVETDPAHGMLSGTAPNLTYTPNANYAGADSFTFTVNDGTADSAPATVSITVNAPVTSTVLELWDFNDDSGTQLDDVTNTGSIGTAWNWADATWVADGAGALTLSGAIGNDWKSSEVYSPFLTDSGAYSYEMTISAWSHDAAAAGSSLKSKIRNPAGQTMAEVQFVMDADKAHATINSGNTNYRNIDLGGLSGGPVSIRVDFNTETLTSEYFVNGDSKYTFSNLNASVMTNGIKDITLSREGGWSSAAMVLSVDRIKLSLEGISVDVDTDGDGLTDVQEIALGTDPDNPDSLFEITESTLLPATGKIEITWPSANGVLYRIWESPNLVDWFVARNWAAAATPPEDVLEFDLSPSNGFFKVEAELQ